MSPKPVKPKACRLARSRETPALPLTCGPATPRASARADEAWARVASASARVGLSFSACRITASSSGEFRAVHHGPALAAPASRRAAAGTVSPAPSVEVVLGASGAAKFGPTVVQAERVSRLIAAKRPARRVLMVGDIGGLGP